MRVFTVKTSKFGAKCPFFGQNGGKIKKDDSGLSSFFFIKNQLIILLFPRIHPSWR